MKGTPRYVRFRGRWMRLHEAAREAGIDYDLTCKRVSRGWPPETALERPARRYGRATSTAHVSS